MAEIEYFFATLVMHRTEELTRYTKKSPFFNRLPLSLKIVITATDICTKTRLFIYVTKLPPLQVWGT